jgi:hypothetical protein
MDEELVRVEHTSAWSVHLLGGVVFYIFLPRCAKQLLETPAKFEPRMFRHCDFQFESEKILAALQSVVKSAKMKKLTEPLKRVCAEAKIAFTGRPDGSIFATFSALFLAHLRFVFAMSLLRLTHIFATSLFYLCYDGIMSTRAEVQ